MAAKFALIEDDLGRLVRYKRYGARLPEFLEKYGPKDGYRVEIEKTDLLSLQKGRLSLLREAINAGKKPGDVGLPGIEADVNTLVFTAKLLDPQDRVVRSASAAMKVEDFKDFEELETAANQRLLAACGFGGEIFDEDEDRDLLKQGLSHRPPGTAPPDAQSPALPAHPTPAAPPSTFEETTEEGSLSDDQDEGDEVPMAVRKQIENLARSVRQPVPQLRTHADVKAARRELGSLDRRTRGSNGRAGQSPPSG